MSYSAPGAFIMGELAWGTPPAFGGDSATGWKKIPPGVIVAPKIPEHGYSGGLPIGYMDPPTMTLTVHTARLKGDADLEDLIDYIVEPAYDVVDVDYTHTPPAGAALEIIPLTYRAINTTNLWTWLTDDGDGSLAVGSFRVAIEAGHDRSTTQTHETQIREANTVISLTLVHILWLCAAQVLPTDIQRREILMIASAIYYSERFLFDVVWASSTGAYARVLGSNPNETDYDDHRLMPVTAIWEEIRGMLENAYKAFARRTVTVVSTEAKGPLGRVVLREPSQTVANTAGSTITIPHLVTSITGAVSEDDRGGWLSSVGGTDGTLHAYETLDQFLIALSEGCVQKMSVRYSAIGAMVITDYGVTSGFASLAITTDADWRGSTLQIGEGVISGADAEIEGSQEGDQQNIKHRLANVRETSNWTVPAPIHNQPHIGPINQVWYQVLTRGGVGFQTVGSPIVTRNCLWAMVELKNGSGVGVGTVVPVRPHHKVGITDGATTYDECSDGIALPNPGSLPGLGGAPWTNDLWYPLRDAMLSMQINGCLPTAAVRRMCARFGDKKQTVYPGDVEATVAGTEQLGRRVTVGWDSGQDLTGEVFHATIPGSPILISTSLDEATGRATVKLIALGGT